MRDSKLILRKIGRGLAVVCMAFVLAAAVHGASTVERFLPTKNAIKGWSILPNSLQYGKGNDLTKIYNGGYELYTTNGVIDAARQMYQRDNDYVEVTIHTMKSEKATTDFYNYWKKQFKATASSKSIRSANFFITKPSVARYFVTGKYFTTVVAFHDVKKSANDTEAFMTAIDKSIRAATQKGKKR